MVKRFVIFILTSLLFMSGTALADSLWGRSQVPFYGISKKPILVGDIITVYVAETTSAIQEASTKTGKDSSISASFEDESEQISTELGNLRDDKEYLWGFGGEDNYNGTGKTSRKSEVRAVVTAVVTEILDSGNLFIVGERKIKVNNEMQTIRISGVIRPSDIAANNSVRSSQLAKAELSINGAGVVADKQAPGVMSKVFNWMF